MAAIALIHLSQQTSAHANMTMHFQIPPWVYVLIGWIGGIVATVLGSWLASKIRTYHDSVKSHHDDLKNKVLTPLRDVLTMNLPLFKHGKPVVFESWERLAYAKDARAEEDAGRHGPLLKAVNPWTETFDSVDRALFEDARTGHHKELISEALAVAASWEKHCQQCLKWAGQIAVSILKSSKMNAYPQSTAAPCLIPKSISAMPTNTSPPRTFTMEDI
jgi:hypothetical protein